MTIRTVALTVSVRGNTDRDMWEWADAVARTLQSMLNEAGEGLPEFGQAIVSVVDVEELDD